MGEQVAAPADQVRTKQMLTIMRENGALNEGEYRALLGALRADLVEAVWAAQREWDPDLSDAGGRVDQ